MQTAASPARRSWTWDEYVRMGEIGILPENGVELIGGEVRERNVGWTPRRWTYDDWERMVAGGIVDEDERLELVDGDLVRMTPVGDRHMYTVDLVAEYLWTQMRGRGIVRVQSPLKFHTGEALVPDLVLLRMTEDRYAQPRPDPGMRCSSWRFPTAPSRATWPRPGSTPRRPSRSTGSWT
jgi:hypothetical protein